MDYIYILKVVVCSTISIFRQQAAFVRNVQIKRNKCHLFRFICTFLTKAACCRNIEIVLHTTTLSIFNVLWCDASSTYYIYIYIYMQKCWSFISVNRRVHGPHDRCLVRATCKWSCSASEILNCFDDCLEPRNRRELNDALEGLISIY